MAIKVGIDARFWGHAGPGRYVKNLVQALEQEDQENKYVVFLNSAEAEKYVPSNSNFCKVVVNAPWYSFWEQIKLPFLFARENLDLLHIPHFNIPIFYPGKIAVTIHDLTIHRFSTARATTRWRPFNLVKRVVYKFVFMIALKRANIIFVPTNFVKDDLLSEYSWLKEEKIIVTYEGVGDAFRLVSSSAKNVQNSNRVLSKYGVDKPYLLYVGSMYPHKNLERLVRAFSLVAEEYNDLSLVLVGKKDYFQERIKEEIEDNKYGIVDKDRIVFPAFEVESGYVPDEDLAAFYKNALAFVFPSLSEGFGLPPLEAMQFGVPVVASNATCIPEVCGDAALYFDPRDRDDVVSKLRAVVKNSGLRKNLVQKGSENLEKFSWRKTAKKTLAGYRDAICL